MLSGYTAIDTGMNLSIFGPLWLAQSLPSCSIAEVMIVGQGQRIDVTHVTVKGCVEKALVTAWSFHMPDHDESWAMTGDVTQIVLPVPLR
jgi:hypothetical protein